MTIDKKYYPHLIGGIVILVIGLFGLKSLFPKTENPNPNFPTNNEITIQVTQASTTSVSYTITNNTDHTLGIWPTSCASQTVDLYTVSGTKYAPTFAPPEIQCLMMPQVVGIKAGSTYSGVYSPAFGNDVIPKGTYALRAVYGTYTEPYQLETENNAYSNVFTVK